MDIEQTTQKRKRTQKDYSLAFKLQLVDEVEKGYLTSWQAREKYGIQGHTTVLKWLRKLGRLNWDHGGKMDSNQTPYKKIKEMEKRIKELEQDKDILNTAIDIADDMFNTNIRKKYLNQAYKSIRQRKTTK